MKTRSFAVALAALICAAPALAHGWPPPFGGGTPAYSGPAGGSSGNADGAPAGGGGNADAGNAYGGPVGGGGPPGSTPTAERPRAQTVGGASGGRVGSAPAAKPKGGGQPWLDRVRIPWVPVFLPAIAAGGYAARVGTVADGVRLSRGEGGWSRDRRPVMVFAYDATNADHKRLLAALDTDGRVKTAAHFFNCFRVDVGAFGEKGPVRDVRLSVFTTDGTLVGELTGRRKLTGVYDLIESAWKKQTASELTNRVAKMDGLLKARAHSEHFIPLCEAGIVCPDCGHERLDILERIAELKARAEACDRAIEDLRIVAKN